MIIRARAPLRLGLAGGGTDVSPYCDLHGGFVLNATIDKYAYAIIEPSPGHEVTFCATDGSLVRSYGAAPVIAADGTLDLHKGVYNRVVRDFNGGKPIPLKLSTFIDAPPGSGLGSSSTLVVAMLKAFMELLNLPLGDYELARLAYEIERVDVGLQGGRQDQYAATFGGFNFMEFYAGERVIVNPLRIKNWILSELEASLLLFFTGVSRESAKIIAEQSSRVASGDETSLTATHRVKADALAMKESLLRGELRRLAEQMEDAWQAKKKLASSISNARIDEIYEGARRAGALAGKVSGAGGGGFMMFMVDPVRRMEVISYLQTVSGTVFNCHFTKTGTQGWRIE
jgi:D-glycero-alpha-D-manno-heptose-7-phosphate kinase